MNPTDHQAQTKEKQRRVRYVRAALRLLEIVLLALVFGLVVMLLWNAILPRLFAVRGVTYWQAVGLLILARTLFGLGIGFRRYRFTGTAGPLTKRRDFVEWWQQSGKREFEEYAARHSSGSGDE